MKIYSFDGLNRCGKGTLTSGLRAHFRNDGIPVEIIRGDGSRPGIGSYDFHDPHNEFWKNWQKNEKKTDADWDHAYNVLSFESYYRTKQFHIENKGEGVILMDRSYFSRWFVLRQRNLDTTLSQTLTTRTVRPDIYFIFDVSKETLLRRCEDDSSKKSSFRRKVIEDNYNLWQDTVNNIPEGLEKVVTIDGENSINGVFEEVLSHINQNGTN